MYMHDIASLIEEITRSLCASAATFTAKHLRGTQQKKSTKNPSNWPDERPIR